MSWNGTLVQINVVGLLLTTKKAPWKSANSVPVVNAPCSLLPDAIPDTMEKAAPEPKADIILQGGQQSRAYMSERRDLCPWPIMHPQSCLRGPSAAGILQNGHTDLLVVLIHTGQGNESSRGEMGILTYYIHRLSCERASMLWRDLRPRLSARQSSAPAPMAHPAGMPASASPYLHTTTGAQLYGAASQAA